MKSMSFEGDGAQGRNRTTDTAIFSRMLYQLSYLGRRRDARAECAAYRGGLGACPALPRSLAAAIS